MKWKWWLFGIFFAVCLPTGACAGELNAQEQAVLSVAAGTFEYEGVVYQATSEYINQARAKFMQDDVDLTDEQAEEIIASIYANIEAGIEEGYIVPIVVPDNENSSPIDSGEEAESTEKETENTQKEAQDAEAIGSFEHTDTSVNSDVVQKNETSAVPEEEEETVGLPPIEEEDTDVGQVEYEELYPGEEAMEWSEPTACIPKHIILSEGTSETEAVIKDTGYQISGLFAILLLFVFGTGISTMCIIKYHLLAHGNES